MKFISNTSCRTLKENVVSLSDYLDVYNNVIWHFGSNRPSIAYLINYFFNLLLHSQFAIQSAYLSMMLCMLYVMLYEHNCFNTVLLIFGKHDLLDINPC